MKTSDLLFFPRFWNTLSSSTEAKKEAKKTHMGRTASLEHPALRSIQKRSLSHFLFFSSLL
jgi:hypothetical protein